MSSKNDAKWDGSQMGKKDNGMQWVNVINGLCKWRENLMHIMHGEIWICMRKSPAPGDNREWWQMETSQQCWREACGSQATRLMCSWWICMREAQPLPIIQFNLHIIYWRIDEYAWGRLSTFRTINEANLHIKDLQLMTYIMQSPILSGLF